MGDIVHIDLPFEGDKFKIGEAFGAVESVKTSAEVYASVDFEVEGNNEDLESNPALVNDDAEGKGWISKVIVEDVGQLENLLDESGYKKFLEEEEH
jgi:glycine cleavage system H protein